MADDHFDDSDDALAPRKQKPRKDEIDVAPLIDVTFLLLMYFMVQQALNPRGDALVPEARHGVPTDKKTSSVISVKSVKGQKLPRIILGDTSGEDGSFAAIPRYVQNGLKQQKHDVIIQAEREVPYGFVQQVIKAVNKVEGVRIAIAVKDKK